MTRKKAKVYRCVYCHQILTPETEIPGYLLCVLCNALLGVYCLRRIA